MSDPFERLVQLITEALEFAARAQGLSALYLFTEATALFSRLGWAPADREQARQAARTQARFPQRIPAAALAE